MTVSPQISLSPRIVSTIHELPNGWKQPQYILVQTGHDVKAVRKTQYVGQTNRPNLDPDILITLESIFMKVITFLAAITKAKESGHIDNVQSYTNLAVKYLLKNAFISEKGKIITPISANNDKVKVKIPSCY